LRLAGRSPASFTLGVPTARTVMAITDYERLLWVLAEQIESATRAFLDKADDPVEWVDSIGEARSLGWRIRGIFVATLVGELEEKMGRSFSSVFAQLPDTPTSSGSKYWFESMPSTSTPRGRASVMWALRLAYTHGNGKVSQVSDIKISNFLDTAFAGRHFSGIRIDNDVVALDSDATFIALRTALEIKERFS